MKKGIKLTVLPMVLSVSVLLGACSERSSVPVNDEKKTEEVKVEKKVEQQKKEVDSRKEIADYSEKAIPILASLKKNMDDIAEISRIGSQSPELIMTDKYQDTVALICANMKKNIQAYRSIKQPADKKLLESHNLTLKAVDEIEFVADNFPVAVQTLDADLMIECSEAMTNSVSFMQDATSALQGFTEEL